MIRQAFAGAGLAPLAVIGLLLFVSVFVGVAIWAFTRSRRQVETWSSLPLADGTEPVERRGRSKGAPGDSDSSDRSATTHDHGGGGCGKCLECTCHPESPPALVVIQ